MIDVANVIHVMNVTDVVWVLLSGVWLGVMVSSWVGRTD